MENSKKEIDFDFDSNRNRLYLPGGVDEGGGERESGHGRDGDGYPDIERGGGNESGSAAAGAAVGLSEKDDPAPTITGGKDDGHEQKGGRRRCEVGND